MKKLFLLLATVGIIFTACENSGVDDLPQPRIEVAGGEESLSLDFPSDGVLEKSVTFNSNYDWSATSYDEWIKVSPESGEAGKECQITISLDPNDAYNARNGKVTISTEDFSIKLSVSQSPKNGLILSYSEMTIPQSGRTFDITVLSNVDFEYEIKAEWIKAVESRALAESTVRFKAEANPTTDERTGEILFKGEGLTATLTITQSQTMPTNAIYYTSSDGAIVEPYNGDYSNDAFTTFGANITSNTYENGLGIITFDGDVTQIGERAFSSLSEIDNCLRLTSITIPDSVTKIGAHAFLGCTSLTSAPIPESVTSIEGYAFEDCESLESVTIPDNVTHIGERAFVGCNNLSAFYGKFASDDNYCLVVDGVLNSFAIGCGETEYTIPDDITTIGQQAFVKCKSLTNITIPDSVTEIRNQAFMDCSALESITIPDSITQIDTEAFNRCTSLKEATIGSGLTSIGNYVFAYCKLTNVVIPNTITSLGEGAFYGCNALKSVTIPDSVTSIGEYAFEDCTSLKSVTIPDSVTSIGERVFFGCTALKEVYCKRATPPMGGASMFNNNASGRKIYVPRNSVEAYKAASGWSYYASYIVGYDF